MDVLLFDLDGTLVDTAPDIIDALNRTLAETNLSPVDDVTGRSFIGGGARHLVASGMSGSQGPPVSDDELDRAYASFVRYYTERSSARSNLYPGVREALDGLIDMDIAMGVCTNKPQDLSVDVLEAFDLNKYFRTVIGGDALPERKPAASHLLETAHRTAPGYERAIMIGDSPTDVAGARNADMPVIVVNYGYTTTPVLELGADAVISDMQEVLPIINSYWDAA